MEAAAVVAEKEARIVDGLARAHEHERHRNRLEVVPAQVGDGRLAKHDHAARLYRDETARASLDVGLRPRALDEVLLAQVDLVGLQVAPLLVVLKEHHQSRLGQPAEEAEVDDFELLKPNVERLGHQRAARASRDDLEEAIVEVETNELHVWLHHADLPDLRCPSDAVRHVALCLRDNFLALRVIRENAKLVALGGDEDLLRGTVARLPELHRRHAAVQRHVVQQH